MPIWSIFMSVILSIKIVKNVKIENEKTGITERTKIKTRPALSDR